jgi:SAM-dependent methyltransferase
MLASAEGIAWHYVECSNLDELFAILAINEPDALVLNYHPDTLGWAAGGLTGTSAAVFAVFHEVHQRVADELEPNRFQFWLCPDPTLLPRNPIALPVPRFIPALVNVSRRPPEVFTIGSFGFATPGKGYDRLCALANAQFETARIRINIPLHDHEAVVSRKALADTVEACLGSITKPGIQLEISHDFLEDDALLAFLSENTLNAFLYEDGPERGIASTADYALACGRPLAVSRSCMFRHLHGVNPSICVEDRPLAAIAGSGDQPLRHHRDAYRYPAAGAVWNRAILDAIAARAMSRDVPDARGFNKILDERSRDAYRETVHDLQLHAPELFSRKIARANIQQAFALDAVERLVTRYREPRILAIGSFEDTAVAVLKAKGFRIDEVDPNVNGLDLEEFYRLPNTVPQSYDLILCVSVLEHVANDEAFVRIVGDLLAPDGVAIFTVDLSNRYPVDGQKPAGNHRLYSAGDIRNRLMSAVPDCALLDYPCWDDGEDDFEYDGCRYSFASWVFRKLRLRRHLVTNANLSELFEKRTALLGINKDHVLVSGPFYTLIGTETSISGVKGYSSDGAAGGFLIYGPYIFLEPGRYSALISLKIDRTLSATIAEIDVYSYSNATTFGRHVLQCADQCGELMSVLVPFVLERNVPDIEFRIFAHPGAVLSVIACVTLFRV